MQPEGGSSLMHQSKSPIHKTVFPDGLTVVTERMPYVRSVSLGVWIRAGARTDCTEKAGMAHFIEHMLFKGTERRSVFEIADSLESLGGSLNAFTSRDMTCYYVSVLDEHLRQAIDILADILNHSLFVPEEIEREKLVVLEEIRSSQDVPEELVEDIFGDVMLSPDPAGKPILGTPESVQSFTREEIIEYLARWYTSSSIVIAAAGNIEHDTLAELVSSYFTFSDADKSPDMQQIAQVNETRIDIVRKIQQSHICLGGRTFGYADDRRTALWLLNTLLGNGMSSRLFQNIREKHGLAYSIYSFTELLQDKGFITTYAATETGNLEKTIDLIREEYRNLSEASLDSETMDRVKSQLKGSLVLNLESTSNRMSRLAKQEILLGTHHDIDTTIHMVEGVTSEAVRQVSQEVFSPESLRTVVITPSKRRKSSRSERSADAGGQDV
ncbi:MAG: M16 family metallopeptidase [Candidatus Latescibacterota bacterium]